MMVVSQGQGRTAQGKVKTRNSQRLKSGGPKVRPLGPRPKQMMMTMMVKRMTMMIMITFDDDDDDVDAYDDDDNGEET
eukprot:10470451-Karenia_brevis.AAC.1